MICFDREFPESARLLMLAGAEVWGDAYRKPRLYGGLIAAEVAPPFVRPAARR